MRHSKSNNRFCFVQPATSVTRGREEVFGTDNAARVEVGNLLGLEVGLQQEALLTGAAHFALCERARRVDQTAKRGPRHLVLISFLAAAAEESSSSILQLSATNDEVVENIVQLNASVRETAASIEEMAFSIREVAKNVDALSLTAEETSSSMNQMDVSIDQVQSNANETARLSEEVAEDAERGAESILKTIGEIYRIKESSQEAVSVISNLGSRIDAIGQILNVIDEVAEHAPGSRLFGNAGPIDVAAASLGPLEVALLRHDVHDRHDGGVGQVAGLGEGEGFQ